MTYFLVSAHSSRLNRLSEALSGLSLPLSPVKHAVYQKTAISPDDTTLPVITLNPAELHVSSTPAIIRTVLGSCVAITMFNRRRQIATICYALLSYPEENDLYTANYVENRKYISHAIPEMVEKMREYGILPGEIEVKVFGGSDTLSQYTGQERNHSVGTLNVKAAMEVLETEGLRLKASDVGGRRGRKILFYTHTGEVLLKPLRDVPDVEF